MKLSTRAEEEEEEEVTVEGVVEAMVEVTEVVEMVLRLVESLLCLLEEEEHTVAQVEDFGFRSLDGSGNFDGPLW